MTEITVQEGTKPENKDNATVDSASKLMSVLLTSANNVSLYQQTQ